jgi:CheY-like chemotaxis protein
MSKIGAIVIVEDDPDDQEVLTEALTELGIENDLVFFEKSFEAFHYLKTTTQQPFIILSDVNLPGQNGVEFKRSIDLDPQLRSKSIPFIFYSTSAEKHAVDIAFRELTVQGFFLKSPFYTELKNNLKLIIDYWKISKHPNSM